LLVPAAVLGALGSGCPQQLDKLCPTTSTPAGKFTLALALQGASDQCRVVRFADGGPTDGDVAATPSSQQATICAGPDPDGGALMYLAVQGHSEIRQSALGADGSFTVQTSSTGVSGTVCGCTVDITETISGYLVT